MSVYMKNGTPLHGPMLCETCSNAHIEKGYRESEQLTFCRALYPAHRVRFPMRECTNYMNKTRQGLVAMERIAWIVATRRPKRVSGFVHASEFVNEDRELELPLVDKD